MPIPFRLDHVIEALLDAEGGEREALRALAGVRLGPAAARAAWARIVEHKWYLSERLGRDVGLRVAAIDYFENIAPPPPRSRDRLRAGTVLGQGPVFGT